MKDEENSRNAISEDVQGFSLHTQNPRRFPGFAVVVVVVVVVNFSWKSLTFSMMCFENVFFLKKNRQPILERSPFFPRKSDNCRCT